MQSFRDSVRLRDGGCVITGEEALDAQYGGWRGFEAAHIFPLAYQSHWEDQHFSRWITVQAEHPINSVQNGLLLRADVHLLFDGYDISVNPNV